MIQCNDGDVRLDVQNLPRVHDPDILNQRVRETVPGYSVRIAPAQSSRKKEGAGGIHGDVPGGHEPERVGSAAAHVVRDAGLVPDLDIPGEIPSQGRVYGYILHNRIAECLGDQVLVQIFCMNSVNVKSVDIDILVERGKSTQDLSFCTLPTSIKEAGLQSDLDPVGHNLTPFPQDTRLYGLLCSLFQICTSRTGQRTAWL